MKVYDNIYTAEECIRKGGVVLCPADTIWGLSADARNPAAVDKVFKIKRRPKNKSLIVLVSSLDMLHEYVKEVPQVALELIQKKTKASTIIYRAKENLASNTVADNGTVAIRLVEKGFVYDLIEQLKFPIVSSSANLSGDPFPLSFASINEDIKNEVDYCVSDMEDFCFEGEVSSIYLIEGNTLKKIR